MAAARQGGSSITRALRVVEAVAVAGDGVTAKAIARRLGCPLPTVYRALGTLVEEGYLVRLHDAHGYGLGYRVAELHRSLTEQVRPEPALRTTLREVHTAAAAAAYLAVFRDVDVVVAHVDDCADHPRPDALRVGEPTPAHATAAGKVMLAGLRPARLSELLERTGLRVGEDFFLCFSPERIDPGNPKYHTTNIPKVVGGITPACTRMGSLFYSQALEKVVPVSSTSVAEMVKLLENTFRMINIGLVNELAMMCDRMGINVWEVIDAAATKPFGYMPFYPGPGLGGHCIPIDPFYLSWKTRQAGIEARFIELAGYINGQMPHFVVDKVQAALNEASKPLRGSHVHVLGVAYKRDIDDVRESPALDIILLLEQKGAHITYSDPYVAKLGLDHHALTSTDSLSMAGKADCVVVVTDHSDFDYPGILQRAKLIVDARNAFKNHKSDKIVRL